MCYNISMKVKEYIIFALCFVGLTTYIGTHYSRHQKTAITKTQVVIYQRHLVAYKQPKLDKALSKSDFKSIKDVPSFNSVEEVNQWVNDNVEYSTDQNVYGVSDHWATLNEVLKHKAGDCEDYAIAKYELILNSNIKVKSMNFYLLKIKTGKYKDEYHIVLVVDGKVLDSLTDDIIQDGTKEFDSKFKYLGSPTIKH